MLDWFLLFVQYWVLEIFVLFQIHQLHEMDKYG